MYVSLEMGMWQARKGEKEERRRKNQKDVKVPDKIEMLCCRANLTNHQKVELTSHALAVVSSGTKEQRYFFLRDKRKPGSRDRKESKLERKERENK